MGIRTSVHTEKCLTRENDHSYIVCTQTMSFRLTMFRVLRTCKVNNSQAHLVHVCLHPQTGYILSPSLV